MWRRHPHGPDSTAELSITIELQKRGLLHKLKPLDSVALFCQDHIEIVHKEDVTHDMIDEAEAYTIPDRLAWTLEIRQPWYFDGPPHLRNGIRERDERINQLWREHGIEPERWSYRGRLPNYLRDEICDRIEHVLNGDKP